MPTCKKCHQWKKKSVYGRHEKNCIPVKSQIEHFLKSKSGRHSRDCGCAKCVKRRKSKSKKKAKKG